ncbi:hypothetical protein EVG20_g4580 [Dentipellis fragilis]|uniref:BTB domain-containing protein n=1 Tax=Dentipellis fragilis TaxID=205917 RepID=A0A4Y9YVQ4_9AGAM|nr:hypothetical protein EVG20_g4580 [Dentipellis fragilis]
MGFDSGRDLTCHVIGCRNNMQEPRRSGRSSDSLATVVGSQIVVSSDFEKLKGKHHVRSQALDSVRGSSPYSHPPTPAYTAVLSRISLAFQSLLNTTMLRSLSSHKRRRRSLDADNKSSNAGGPRNAGAPFDDPDADIIVRSIDGVDFRIYKNILTKASRGFADMFAAQPMPANLPLDASDPNFKNGLPVIPLTEDSHVLRSFFQLLYPMNDPDLDDPEVLEPIMVALGKYVVEGYEAGIEKVLLRMASLKPQSAYAIACRHKLPKILREAANESLKNSDFLFLDAQGGQLLSLPQYYQLGLYRITCKNRARRLINDLGESFFENVPGADVTGVIDLSNYASLSGRRCTCELIHREFDPVPLWFRKHMAEYAKALDLRPHPSTLENLRIPLSSENAQEMARCEYCSQYVRLGLHNHYLFDLPEMIGNYYNSRLETYLAYPVAGCRSSRGNGTDSGTRTWHCSESSRRRLQLEIKGYILLPVERDPMFKRTLIPQPKRIRKRRLSSLDRPSSPGTYRDAGAPFDDLDADIIVRSSDGVDFRIYRNILAKASHAFADMFAAQPKPAQPPVDASDLDFKDGLPVIPLQEDHHVLRSFFQLLYPMDGPDLQNPEILVPIMATLQKYVVEGYEAGIKRALSALASERPLLVYGLACRYRLPEILREAANESLKVPGILYQGLQEFLLVSKGQHYQIELYRVTCIDRAHLSINSMADAFYDDVSGAGAWTDLSGLPCTCKVALPEVDQIPAWFRRYMDKYADALSQSPHPSTLAEAIPLSPELAEEIARCKYCSEYVRLGLLVDFVSSLRRDIENRYKSIPLKFEGLDVADFENV